MIDDAVRLHWEKHTNLDLFFCRLPTVPPSPNFRLVVLSQEDVENGRGGYDDVWELCVEGKVVALLPPVTEAEAKQRAAEMVLTGRFPPFPSLPK